MQPIKIYYHLTPQPHWQEFYENKINLMKTVGLWDAAAEISLNTHYEYHCQEQLKKFVGDDSRVKYIFHHDSVRPFGEQYTNRRILFDSLTVPIEDYYIFRVHSKGVNHYDTPEWERNKRIADEMDYYNIIKWRECVDKLDQDYDAVGAWWVKQPWPHFKGNYWWTTRKYVSTLRQLRLPHDNNFVQQITGGGWTVHDAESWIGTGNPSPHVYDILRETDIIGDHPDL